MTAGNVTDQKINFESYRSSLMSEKYKQNKILAIFKNFKQPSDT